MDWVTPDQLLAERERFMRRLEAWRADWESRDAGQYAQAQGQRSEELDQGRFVERERAARGGAGQYWVEQGGGWKIAYENTLGGQKLRLPESFKSATKGARS